MNDADPLVTKKSLGLTGIAALGACAACDTVCTTDRRCGCSTAGDGGSIFSTSSPRPEEPIVCTADLRDKPTVQGQLDGYRAAFQHLLRVERFEGGARWIFENRPGLDVELRKLAEKEHQCCGFFKFDVRAERDTLVWETTARAGAAKVLDEFARLPERLEQYARGNETKPIKQAIGNAGLIFAADATQRGSVRV
jgi:hypothetical protein